MKNCGKFVGGNLSGTMETFFFSRLCNYIREEINYKKVGKRPMCIVRYIVPNDINYMKMESKGNSFVFLSHVGNIHQRNCIK